jgi:hypothetical protein
VRCQREGGDCSSPEKPSAQKRHGVGGARAEVLAEAVGSVVAGHLLSMMRYSWVGENGGWCRLPRFSRWLCVGLRLAQLGGDPHALQAHQQCCLERGDSQPIGAARTRRSE